MAKDSKTKLKKVKSSKESKPKSEPFAPEAHPFIKKLAANGRYQSSRSRVPIQLTNKWHRPSYQR